MKKEINKKMAFWAIGLFITIATLIVLSIRVCAPCTYQFNNRDYNKECNELCVSTSYWKILLFNLTGKKVDIKGGSQITPSPL